MLKFKVLLILGVCLIVGRTVAASFDVIHFSNNMTQSTVILEFDHLPTYSFFSLHNPERVVLDIRKSDSVKELSLNFGSKNIIKHIRTSHPLKHHNIRLVFELTQKSHVTVKMRKIGQRYNIKLNMITQSPPMLTRPPLESVRNNLLNNQVTIVAIDAGHGGQDPGAIGFKGLNEKNVTIAIARKLKALLNAKSMFKPVLTRDSDFFMSVMSRSDVARKKGANILVSIHADAAPNRNARGMSVWILSNKRAKNELGNWLEKHKKEWKLLGGAGDVLIKNQSDPYLRQTMLDLQFGYAQRVGHDIAVKILRQMQKVGVLHKRRPEHASFGVLCSPDIPSLLVETGFISNIQEERLLGSNAYQTKIANALFLGLRDYFLEHALQSNLQVKNRPDGVNTDIVGHIVKRGETLSCISRRYRVSIKAIHILNELKTNRLLVGQRLWIPMHKIGRSPALH
ncbi:N-acetylmuramoyl-L-alanine amidase [Candidatus Steffania adelgidicola]|uniref:N-acetylmuramoyl-L-alanine amidase n=1 Tax=Candidatus Steffania adelgidicola TaxID=1076626 RepID=UPI001D014506|nr:N-acetylmuramoyl-L-alanine amidase [Candidatus Steffania adelgidicola]UDG79508.1 N-acetylmuramoyl-L-alanine amidase AmiB [Candidatus Steffania adelgidicola]